jgi:hypothetical protein
MIHDYLRSALVVINTIIEEIEAAVPSAFTVRRIKEATELEVSVTTPNRGKMIQIKTRKSIYTAALPHKPSVQQHQEPTIP